MKRLKARSTTDLKMDLTPLIDCVFLLILFFILTTELTVQVEEVELPFAIEAKKGSDPPKGGGTILINVVRVGATKDNPRAGKVRYNGEDVDLDKLTRMLQKEADHHARPQSRGGKGFGWEMGPGGQELSKLAVIVRADRGVQSKYLRTVFTACAKARIYKVKVSAVQPEGARKK